MKASDSFTRLFIDIMMRVIRCQGSGENNDTWQPAPDP